MAFETIRKWLANKIAPSPVKPSKASRVSGAYDAAQDGIDSDHWAWSDSLNANAANSPGVRKTLRERSRYECENNGYAGGLVDKLTKDMVGTIPRIRLSVPGADRKIVRAIERRFATWAQSIGLGEKLRMLDTMAIRDGEGFATFGQNPMAPADDVQLDLKLFEADQITTPYMNYLDLKAFDGGRLDEFGNVTEWHFLKAHPGSNLWLSAFIDVDKVPAKNVIQWFRPRRAGQLRGVPETASALTLYAYLRRYTLATVTAAETAASISGVLETETLPNGDGPQDATAFEQIPVPRGTMMTVPAGWKARGFDATHPTSTYREFKAELLTETGQPVGAPRNISTGSSAEYNYSSARLDLNIYQHGLLVRRHDFSVRVLDRIFREWLNEASLIPGIIPDGLPLRNRWSWTWFYDGFASIDPLKDANADDIRLKNGTSNYAEIFAEYGQDWQEQFEALADQINYARELGIYDLISGRPPAAQPQEEVIPDA